MDEAKRLADSGYRCVSNRHRLVSRIDRPDWREYMGQEHTGGLDWVNALGLHAGDHYRRVYSRDQLELHRTTFDKLKRITRGADENTFMALVEESAEIN